MVLNLKVYAMSRNIRECPAVKTNALKCFNNLLVACAIAGGLN